MQLGDRQQKNKAIVPILSFVLFWACQHVGVNTLNPLVLGKKQNCPAKPFTLEISDKKPIFDEAELPKGVLLFANARLYVEKLDKLGDVQQKIHVSEQFESPRRENLKVQVHCVDGQTLASTLEVQMPALKKIELSPQGNKLESDNMILKLVKGKVEFKSQHLSSQTGATSLKEFFDTFGVHYAFYKLDHNTYELRGYRQNGGINSYIAVQYNLVLFE